MFLQPAVRQPHLHGLGLCQPVVAFGTQPDADGQPFRNAQLDQVADAGARFPPLLEVAHADSAPYPVVQPFHRVKDDQGKVVHPASEVFLQLPVAVFPTDAPRAVGQLADTVLEGCQTGGTPDEIETPELVAEEAEFVHRQDAAFVRVDRQLEGLQEGFDFGFDALPFCKGFCTNHEVVGVTGEPVAFAFQKPVKVVEQDVCQQRRQWTTLGDAPWGGFNVAVVADTCPQVFADQAEDVLVVDPFAQPVHQQVVVYVVEEFRQVDVHGVTVAAPDKALYRPDGVVG